MQFIMPTENLRVYDYSTTTGTGANDWFVKSMNTTALHAANVRIVADNIIGLFIWPKATDSSTDTLTTNYCYDSRLGVASGASATAWPHPSTTPQPLQMNQMPPILRVAMIAIDEPSAKALQGGSTAVPTQIQNLYTLTNPNAGGTKVFTNPQNLDLDLAYVQTQMALITPKINFRVFDTTIAVRNAKFSNP